MEHLLTFIFSSSLLSSFASVWELGFALNLVLSSWAELRKKAIIELDDVNNKLSEQIIAAEIPDAWVKQYKVKSDLNTVHEDLVDKLKKYEVLGKNTMIYMATLCAIFLWMSGFFPSLMANNIILLISAVFALTISPLSLVLLKIKSRKYRLKYEKESDDKYLYVNTAYKLSKNVTIPKAEEIDTK